MAAARKNRALNEVCIWGERRESSSFRTFTAPVQDQRPWPSPPSLGLLYMQWRTEHDTVEWLPAAEP